MLALMIATAKLNHSFYTFVWIFFVVSTMNNIQYLPMSFQSISPKGNFTLWPNRTTFRSAKKSYRPTFGESVICPLGDIDWKTLEDI